MGGVGPIPDSKSLESLVEELKNLAQMADTRGDVCNAGIRELSQKRKDMLEEPESMDRDVGERTRMKREVDDDEDLPIKGGKLKKRKERGGSTKEERPLNHGAHEVARQDGAETKIEGGEFTLLCFHLNSSTLHCLPSSCRALSMRIRSVLDLSLWCIQNANLLQRPLQPRRNPRMRLQRAPLFLLLHERPLTTLRRLAWKPLREPVRLALSTAQTHISANQHRQSPRSRSSVRIRSNSTIRQYTIFER